MSDVSKKVRKTGFSTNKKKAGEGKKIEKFGTLGGGSRFQKERKPPDKTVLEGREVEVITKGNDAMEGIMEGDSEGTMNKVGHLQPFYLCLSRLVFRLLLQV